MLSKRNNNHNNNLWSKEIFLDWIIINYMGKEEEEGIKDKDPGRKGRIFLIVVLKNTRDIYSLYIEKFICQKSKYGWIELKNVKKFSPDFLFPFL